MKTLHLGYSTALGLALALGQAGTSHSTPIDTQTANYNGALLTIDGEWQSASIFQVTYNANFDNFIDQVNAVQIQPDRFTDPQAAAVDNFQQRGIPGGSKRCGLGIFGIAVFQRLGPI